jgi:hypothetical protein
MGDAETETTPPPSDDEEDIGLNKDKDEVIEEANEQDADEPLVDI